MRPNAASPSLRQFGGQQQHSDPPSKRNSPLMMSYGRLKQLPEEQTQPTSPPIDEHPPSFATHLNRKEKTGIWMGEFQPQRASTSGVEKHESLSELRIERGSRVGSLSNGANGVIIEIPIKKTPQKDVQLSAYSLSMFPNSDNCLVGGSGSSRLHSTVGGEEGGGSIPISRLENNNKRTRANSMFIVRVLRHCVYIQKYI